MTLKTRHVFSAEFKSVKNLYIKKMTSESMIKMLAIIPNRFR